VQDWSALDFAEVKGAADVVARLREKGATALHRSAIVSESPPTSVQRAQRDLYAGWPDLAVAASRETPELLQAVLARGADPNATTPDGMPILTVAALSGTAPLVEALLAAGAQATRADRRGNSVLLNAVRIGRQDIVVSMLAHGVSPDGRREDPESPVLAAAKAGQAGILRALLAAHAQPDARDEHGTSALMLVAQTADSESLRRLLDGGAAAEGVDKAGRTALWYAAHAGKLGGRPAAPGAWCQRRPRGIPPGRAHSRPPAVPGPLRSWISCSPKGRSSRRARRAAIRRCCSR